MAETKIRDGEQFVENHAIPFNKIVEVLITAPLGGETLIFDGAQFVNVPSVSGLAELNDVDLSTPPTTGQSLVFNGTMWVPQNASLVATLDDLTDVDIDIVDVPLVEGMAAILGSGDDDRFKPAIYIAAVSCIHMSITRMRLTAGSLIEGVRVGDSLLILGTVGDSGGITFINEDRTEFTHSVPVLLAEVGTTDPVDFYRNLSLDGVTLALIAAGNIVVEVTSGTSFGSGKHTSEPPAASHPNNTGSITAFDVNPDFTGAGAAVVNLYVRRSAIDLDHLEYDAFQDLWLPKKSVSALSDLSDFRYSKTGGGAQITPAAGSIAIFDGATWKPIQLELPLLGDTTITDPSSGQDLIFDGADWVNGFRITAPIGFAKSGNVPNGQFLSHQGVVSNLSGPFVPFEYTLRRVSVSCGVNTVDFTVNIYSNRSLAVPVLSFTVLTANGPRQVFSSTYAAVGEELTVEITRAGIATAVQDVLVELYPTATEII